VPDATEGAALAPYAWDSAALIAAELGTDGTVLRANATLRAFAGRDIAGEGVEDALVAPAQRPAFRAFLAAAGPTWGDRVFALERGSPTRAAVDVRVWVRRSGERILLVGEPPVGEQELLAQRLLELNDELIGAHRALSARTAEVEAARAEAVVSAERLRRLEEIAELGLTRSTLDEVLDGLLAVVRRIFGVDRAAFLLLDPAEGALRVRAAFGLEEEITSLVRIPVGLGIAGRIAETARPMVVEDLTRATVVSPILRDQSGSLAGVPLLVQGRVTGVLHVSTHGRREFTPADVRLLELVAERAALAIWRVQLYEREHTIAATLQRALLPDALPDHPSARLVARYLPRENTADVGGDWYDAIPLGDGDVGLAIGDVAGKGLRAAAVMGDLRSALRAYAAEHRSPERVLALLDARPTHDRWFATVIYAVFSVRARSLTIADAGHPPPLLIPAAGEPRYLSGATAPPLGSSLGPPRNVATQLSPGDTLLLYTDGLIERRHEDILSGMTELRLAAAGASRDLESLCDELLETQRARAPFEDDVALLALRAGTEESPA
jgi:phosphoserine phosphatase RsbU/P